MQHKLVVRNLFHWKHSLWIVVVVTLLILVLINSFFQRKVNAIDHQLENIRTYESK